MTTRKRWVTFSSSVSLLGEHAGIRAQHHGSFKGSFGEPDDDLFCGFKGKNPRIAVGNALKSMLAFQPGNEWQEGECDKRPEANAMMGNACLSSFKFGLGVRVCV